MVSRGAKGLVGGIAGKFGFGKAKEEKPNQFSDDVVVKIYQFSDNLMDKNKPNKIEVSSGQGRWLSHLVLDGKVVWRIEEQVPQYVVRGEKMLDGSPVLPSDMEKRPDIAYMYAKDWKAAEAARAELTTQQRKDHEMRKLASKERGE